MPKSPAAQSFVKQVADQLGFRFACQLHAALAAGRTDRQTRAALRRALHAVSETRAARPL